MLLFGELPQSVLQNLNASLTNVYQPALVEREEWGQANADEVNEFSKSLDKFLVEVQDTLQSVQGGLELRCPEEDILGRAKALIAKPSARGAGELEQLRNKAESACAAGHAA